MGLQEECGYDQSVSCADRRRYAEQHPGCLRRWNDRYQYGCLDGSVGGSLDSGFDCGRALGGGVDGS